LIRDVPIDPMPRPLKLHLDLLFDEKRGVLVDGDFRVELLDGEVLSKRRRNKKDEVKAQDEENKDD
jgi:hypothetical protein